MTRLCPYQKVTYEGFIIGNDKTLLQPVEDCTLGALDNHITSYPVASLKGPKEVPDDERIVCQYWTGLKCKLLSSTPQAAYINPFEKPNKMPSLDDFFNPIEFNPFK